MERRGAKEEVEDRKQVKLMREERIAFMENIREERKIIIENQKVKERFWEERIRGIEEKIIESENKIKK